MLATRAFRMCLLTRSATPCFDSRMPARQVTRQQPTRENGTNLHVIREIWLAVNSTRECCFFPGLHAAVLEKGLRDRNSPMCTLSQNCDGARRVKARRYTCFLTLSNTTALHACARGKEKKHRGYGASRSSVGHQRCNMAD